MGIISNREQLTSTGGRKTELVLRMIESGISSVLPSKIVPRKVKLREDALQIGTEKTPWPPQGDVYVLGAGKASASMARELYKIIGNHISRGTVITDDGKETGKVGPIRIEKGGHPVPNRSGLRAAKRLKETAQKMKGEDFAICLISGGGSSLMSLPVEEIPLPDLVETNELLIKSGADITEINSIRKHISQIKGGKLAEAIHPGRTVTMIISDVAGNDPENIASGPTAADPTTFRDAFRVLEKYDLKEKLPSSTHDYLKQNKEASPRETVKPEKYSSFKVSNQVIAENLTALEAMKKEADRLDLKALILSPMIEGDSKHAGKILGMLGKSMITEGKPLTPPAVLISGGETTVEVSGEGRGGPNQELILGAKREIKGFSQSTIASIDSDGKDGNSKYAGGIVSGDTFGNKTEKEIEKALKNHCSSSLLEKENETILTGRTGTNVNDIRTVLAL